MRKNGKTQLPSHTLALSLSLSLSADKS